MNNRQPLQRRVKPKTIAAAALPAAGMGLGYALLATAGVPPRVDNNTLAIAGVAVWALCLLAALITVAVLARRRRFAMAALALLAPVASGAFTAHWTRQQHLDGHCKGMGLVQGSWLRGVQDLARERLQSGRPLPESWLLPIYDGELDGRFFTHPCACEGPRNVRFPGFTLDDVLGRRIPRDVVEAYASGLLAAGAWEQIGRVWICRDERVYAGWESMIVLAFSSGDCGRERMLTAHADGSVIPRLRTDSAEFEQIRAAHEAIRVPLPEAFRVPMAR